MTSLLWGTGPSPSFPVGFRRTAKKLAGNSFKLNVLDLEIWKIWSHTIYTIFSSWYAWWRRFVMILILSGVIGSGKPSLSSSNSTSWVNMNLSCYWLLFDLLLVFDKDLSTRGALSLDKTGPTINEGTLHFLFTYGAFSSYSIEIMLLSTRKKLKKFW